MTPVGSTRSSQAQRTEFERALIRERQREGIALAKQRGAYRGRMKLLAPDQVAKLSSCISAQCDLGTRRKENSEYELLTNRWTGRPAGLPQV